MSDRKLQFSSDDISYDDAVSIARRELEQNSAFNVEEILQGADFRTGFRSSNNSAAISAVNDTIVVDLNGSDSVIEAIAQALNNEAEDTGTGISRGGQPNPSLGGTGPDDTGFSESNPPSMSQPGEDIEDSREFYVAIGPNFNTRVEMVEMGENIITAREEATSGPFDTRRQAENEEERIANAVQNNNAKAIQGILTQRFWVHSGDSDVFVEVMTSDGTRGKATMPEGLAEEAEMFGYTKIVQDMVPDDGSLPPDRRPDYVTPRHLEGWEEIFNNLQQHPGDEPRVPSGMDDERVPQSEAEKENRMSVASRSDPQATADIYENGVVSLNRDGSVDTLDTSLGVFIDRETNGVTMGYMAERLNLTNTEIDAIVANVRQFLEDNNG